MPQIEVLEDRLAPATITWTGGGTTSNWSDAGNWGGTVPGPNDTAVFNGTSTKSATVDTSFAGTVGAIQINSGYTGTITLDESLTDNGSLSQVAGTLKTNGFTLSVGSNLTITGGTFTNSTGTLNLNGSSGGNLNAPTAALGNVTVNATGTVTTTGGNLNVGSLTLNSGTFVAPSGNLTIAANFTDDGGTFNANSGTLVFASSSGGHTVNVSGAAGSTLDLDNLTLADSGTGTRTYSLTGTLDVAGNFNESPAGSSTSVVVNGGTIAVLGNVSVAPGADGGTTILELDGTAGQTYSSTGGTLPSVEIESTVAPAAGTTSLGVQSLTLASGSFKAPSGTLTVVSNLTQTAGSFSADGGSLVFAAASGSPTINVNSALPLDNLAFEDSGSGTRTYSLTGSLDVSGNFSDTPASASTDVVLNGGTIAVLGNVSVSPGADGGTTNVQLDGTAGQTYSSTGGTLPVLDIESSVGPAAGTTSLGVQDLTLTSGSFTAPSGTFTIVSNLTQTGGSYNANGDTLVIAASSGTHTVNVGSGSLPLDSLTLEDSGSGTRTYTITGTLDVSGNFSELPASSSTSVVVNGGTIVVLGNVSVSPGADGGTTTLKLAGTARQTYTSTGGTLPSVEIAEFSGTVSPAAGTTALAVQSLNLVSGTFVAPSSTLTIVSNLTQTGGTFNANSGTLVFAATTGSRTIDVSSPLSLANLTLADSGSNTRKYTLTGTLDVSGNFNETPAGSSTLVILNGGTIAVQGDVSVAPGADGGTTDLEFAGTAGQTYTATGGTLPAVTIDNSTGSVSPAAGTTNLGVQDLTLTAGSFTAPSGTLTIVSNLTTTAGTLDPNGGTVLFDAGSGNHAIAINSGAAGLLTLNNLIFGDSGTGTRTYTIATGDGFYLDGSFTAQVQAGSTATMLVDGGTFDVTGTVTLGTGFEAGTPAPVFNAITAGTGAISGAVYDDESGSGQEAATDPGLSGWTVNLLSGGNVIATTTTGSSGGYSFLNLAPGTYSVQEVLQAGYTQTAVPSSPITVAAGSNAVVSFGNFQQITISGTVFEDVNGDGQQEVSEAGTPNVTVQLYTESGGTVSANPLQTTTTDAYGNYAFTNLGPLPAGTSYVVAQVAPAGTEQTLPAGSNTITLPDGRTGYLVPATGGVALDLPGQAPLSGTGSYTLNKANNSTTATISFNDGQGDSGSAKVYVSQLNVTFSNSADPVTFNTFCVDLEHEIKAGGTYPVAVETDLAPTFANAGRMADIFQEFGEDDLSDDPVQAAAVQIAEWDLSLNNHDPTEFIEDPDGSYSSGDESVFSVKDFNLSPANTAACVALVNEYLALSIGISGSGAFMQTIGSGQSLLLARLPYNFGITREVPALAPGCG